MKALLLCGGFGRRMAPLCEDKFMLDLLGRPLLLHVIDMLRDAGADDFVLVGNQVNAEELRRQTGHNEDVPCHILRQHESTGMAGAVEAAAEHLDGPVLIVSPNDVVEASAYRKVVEAAEQEQCDAALLAMRTARYFPGGYLVTDPDMRITGIVEKPEPGSEPSDLVNVVVHFHRDGRRLLQALGSAQSYADDRYEVALSIMMGEGAQLRAVPYTGFWGPLKHPWDVLTVMDHFVWGGRRRVAMSSRISSSALIEGAVVVADHARVLENAVIRGPAYIGERAVIGNNVLIRGGSHIGADSVIGFSTEVKHSYIGRQCWFHSNYVGDSVIDDRCSFGSGAVTANLRFDAAEVKVGVNGGDMSTGMDKLGVIAGRDSQVGVNASLMPGVMIGPGSIVGPQVCLDSNLKPGQRVLVRRACTVEVMDEHAQVTARDALRQKLEGI